MNAPRCEGGCACHGNSGCRWFGPDKDGNVMDDGDLAYSLEADSLVPDFIEDARGWHEKLGRIAHARELAEKRREELAARWRREDKNYPPVFLSVEAAHDLCFKYWDECAALIFGALEGEAAARECEEKYPATSFVDAVAARIREMKP